MSNDQDSLNLKATLNLPFTEFPMKAGLAQREPEMLARWQKLDIYQRIADKNIGKTKFILHDGPPYANGAQLRAALLLAGDGVRHVAVVILEAQRAAPGQHVFQQPAAGGAFEEGMAV